MRNTLTLSFVLVSTFAHAMPNSRPLAFRNTHCEVVSAVGTWAMHNYPKAIDIYYQARTEDSGSHVKWTGFVTMAYDSNDWQFKMDKVVLHAASIVFTGTATYAGVTVTGTSEPFEFVEHYDTSNRQDNFELKYMDGAGLYNCSQAWPIGLLR